MGELDLVWKNTGTVGMPAWECDARIDDVLCVGALVTLERGEWRIMLNVAVDNHVEVGKPAKWNYDRPDLPGGFRTASDAREDAQQRLEMIYAAFTARIAP